MVGPGEFGKTEAWYFIAAEAGAQIMAGVKPGVNGLGWLPQFERAASWTSRTGSSVHDGEAILIPAGTVHALGPGLLLYEIQQASDTTYRIYDWDRPNRPVGGFTSRKSAEVALPVGPTETRHPEIDAETGAALGDRLRRSRSRSRSRVSPAGGPLADDTSGRRFHILTVIRGRG